MSRTKRDESIVGPIRERLGTLLEKRGTQEKQTQEQFARKINVPVKTLSNWLSGRGGLSLESLISIAKKTDTSLDWLVLGRGRQDYSDDVLADLLRLRIKARLIKEGATDEQAEELLPAPGELLNQVFAVHDGRGAAVADFEDTGLSEFQRDFLALQIRQFDQAFTMARSSKEGFFIKSRDLDDSEYLRRLAKARL